jgi:rSAM/selenodomain-associated transferase 2
MISIVIPTLDEAVTLGATLASIARDDAVEVIVADGGSTDDTVGMARRARCTVVSSARGRGHQLNAGADAARGDVLLFLHADTRLADGALPAVRNALRDPRTVGGAFRIEVDSRRRSLRVISFSINLRARFLRLPYGDQALFVRRSLFEALGGFRPLEILEDVDFVRRLRRHGRLALLAPPVRTSDRRWRANGVLRTTFANLTAAALGSLAVPPRRIRSIYDALLVHRHGNGRGRP